MGFCTVVLLIVHNFLTDESFEVVNPPRRGTVKGSHVRRREFDVNKDGGNMGTHIWPKIIMLLTGNCVLRHGGFD